MLKLFTLVKWSEAKNLSVPRTKSEHNEKKKLGIGCHKAETSDHKSYGTHNGHWLKMYENVCLETDI